MNEWIVFPPLVVTVPPENTWLPAYEMMTIPEPPAPEFNVVPSQPPPPPPVLAVPFVPVPAPPPPLPPEPLVVSP